MLAMSFVHFAPVDVVGDIAPPDLSHDGGDFANARGERSVEFAYGEPRPLVCRVSLDLPGGEEFRLQFDDATHRATTADDRGDRVVVHAVLQPHQNAVLSEVGFDQFRQPAGIVRLGGQEHDVEIAVERCQLAEMQGPNGDVEIPVLALHVQTAGFHRLDVRRPLIDDRHVQPRPGKIGADTAADRAGPENRHCFAHAFIPPLFFVDRSPPTLCRILSPFPIYHPLVHISPSS